MWNGTILYQNLSKTHWCIGGPNLICCHHNISLNATLTRQRISLQLHELHGFSDASQQAYLRMTCIDERVQVTLVISKMKVAPIKKLTIPRLEMCGAHLLSQLLHHVRQVFQIQTCAWTDSTISCSIGLLENQIGSKLTSLQHC